MSISVSLVSFERRAGGGGVGTRARSKPVTVSADLDI
jgi:hypothetical protein